MSDKNQNENGTIDITTNQDEALQRQDVAFFKAFVNEKGERILTIDKDLVKDEFRKSRQQADKATQTNRKASYIMDKWLKDYPDYAFINYTALQELASRSDQIGEWYAKHDADFNNIITFPSWAGSSLSVEEAEQLKDKFRSINEKKRIASDRKMYLARNVKEAHKRIDEQLESDLKDVMKGDVRAFILTYPKSRLPVDYILAAIQYAAKDKALSDIEKVSDSYVSPNDYESNMLEEFKKDLWKRFASGQDIKEYLNATHGVSFYMPTKSVGKGHLSSISTLVVQRPSGVPGGTQ